MSHPHSLPKRDPKLRLALRIEHLLSTRCLPADPLLMTAELLLSRLSRFQRLAQQHRLCASRRWNVAKIVLSTQLGGELRELQYALGSFRNDVPSAASPTAADVYGDLLALVYEFGGVEIDEDLSTLSVDTVPITLAGIALGRFRIVLAVNRLRDGRANSDAVTAEALDPNPAACNEEVTHPHVQAGWICFDDGSHLVRAALSEGRLYDALVVTRSVLQSRSSQTILALSRRVRRPNNAALHAAMVRAAGSGTG